jgi:glycosyltransferase involved in cell wall biosynthesis
MRIAIAVHGRFEAFDLARELVRRGHTVGLLTNYPAWAAERFGVPRRCVRSFWPHGVLTRALGRLRPHVLTNCEAALHVLFGRWTAAVLRKEPWDVASVFSGVAEESLRAPRRIRLRMVVRASAHIRQQYQLLYEEEQRTAAAQERPSAWMIEREEREYALADVIRVLSRFARQSFLDQGVPSRKVILIASGVQTEAFQASTDEVEARCRRLLAGAPLRVLNVGTFSFRKGVWDSASVIDTLGNDRFEFRFVGSVAAEAAGLAERLRGRATFVPKQPQGRLPAAYAWGDVFMLPTIEDGYPAVLSQASAAGLPVLTTPNRAGWDVVTEGQNGWVPPQAFVERLRWADEHRHELVDMIRARQVQCQVRDSAQVAADFERVCAEYVAA